MVHNLIEVFTKEECDLIVSDFELNKNHIKLSTDHGVERISSYEIDIEYFSESTKNLINSKIEEKIKPLTDGGFVGMVFGVRYSLDTMGYMEAHYDCNSYSCVIKLNDDYKGGGTYFPLTGEIINPKEVGTGILFEADVIKSYHEAYPITEGVRYVLVIRIEKKSMYKLLFKACFLGMVDFFIRKNKKLFYKKPL